MLSITTDYAAGTGCPEPYLSRIAAAGFTHIHWCHQWNTDFHYDRGEIDQIRTWLSDFGLQLLDLHASHGNEKGWVSSREYERLAGISLVTNRIRMTAELGADVIILHIPAEPVEAGERPIFRDRLRRSIDALIPELTTSGVAVAFENMAGDNFPLLNDLLAVYDPGHVGLCYDAGHGNIAGNGLDRLEAVRDRLISVHLHDNDGNSDQHRPLFSGMIDWQRLARIMRSSSYRKPVSMEVATRAAGLPEEEFLLHVKATGERFRALVEA